MSAAGWSRVKRDDLDESLIRFVTQHGLPQQAHVNAIGENIDAIGY